MTDYSVLIARLGAMPKGASMTSGGVTVSLDEIYTALREQAVELESTNLLLQAAFGAKDLIAADNDALRAKLKP